MVQITPGRIEVTRSYTVSDVEPVRDSARCPIDPDEVIVRFANYDGTLRATSVVIKGRRTRGAKTFGRYKQGGYSIHPDGTVEADYRGDEPPRWVQDVVDRAVAEQLSGVGGLMAVIA